MRMNPNISSDRYQTFAKLATHPLREALMFQNGIILDNIKPVFTMCVKNINFGTSQLPLQKQIIESNTKNVTRML